MYQMSVSDKIQKLKYKILIFLNKTVMIHREGSITFQNAQCLANVGDDGNSLPGDSSNMFASLGKSKTATNDPSRYDSKYSTDGFMITPSLTNARWFTCAQPGGLMNRLTSYRASTLIAVAVLIHPLRIFAWG